MADPHRLLATHRGKQFEHVGNDLLLREILVARVGARPAVAAHVGRDAAEAERGQRRKLMPPRE
jgi:hypothetical protein